MCIRDSGYVVQPGDYLSKIAAACYGDAGRWREIWDTNRDRVMDDGRVFSSPDRIYVDWTLRIPGGCAGGVGTSDRVDE